MKSIHLLIMLCVLSSLTVSAAAAGFADYEDYTWSGLFVGGRSTSLANADLTDSSPAALLINPAPLSRANEVVLAYEHSGYYLDDMYMQTFGGAIGVGNWRLCVVSQEFYSDEMVIRTAYDPEAMDTYTISERMTVVGASYDLSRALKASSNFGWSAGAAWRHYATDNASSIESLKEDSQADTLDLGTALSFSSHYDGGWSRATGTVSWQNATGVVSTRGDRDYRLPRPLRLGLTLEMAFANANRPGDLFKVLLAYTRTNRQGETYRRNVNSIGAEILLFDVVALRWGENNRFDFDTTHWGVGVVLGRQILGPLTLEADLGQMKADQFLENPTVLGVRARYAF